MPRAPRLLLLLMSALAFASLVASGATAARADTVTLPAGSGLPWTNPQHQGPLEQLAGRIATHIAGRPVTVRCEGDTDWLKLTTDRGIDPQLESGYVGVEIFTRGGRVTTVNAAAFTELSPGTCAALQSFALADPKPTTCQPPVSVTTTVLKAKSVATRIKVDLGRDPKHPDRRRAVVRTVWKTVQVPTAVTSQQPGLTVPCYIDDPGRAPRFAIDLSRAAVNAYEDSAEAILTLAHEAVHLGGAVGGTTSTGLPYGDQLAEARAECSGMQWMAYVAQQLGGSAADAVAISQFQARWRYPLRNTPGNAAEYWSADCLAGGALDIRADRTAPWPSGLG